VSVCLYVCLECARVYVYTRARACVCGGLSCTHTHIYEDARNLHIFVLIYYMCIYVYTGYMGTHAWWTIMNIYTKTPTMFVFMYEYTISSFL